MSPFKLIIITLLGLLMYSCESDSGQKKKDFSITSNTIQNNKNKQHCIALSETLKLELQNSKNHLVKSVAYTIDGTPIENTIELDKMKLGRHNISAAITLEDETFTISKNITILNSEAPHLYGYEIINAYDHDITSYTQGLEFYNGVLYESTGQYGESKLRKINYKTSEVLKNINLERQYFAEGLTILNKKIYQLTWQEGIGFVYDLDTFEKKSSFNYGQSKEGWGLCNDGEVIYKSDGTENIWLLETNSLKEQSRLQVYSNNGKIGSLNELEWINGTIYANIYQRNGVVIINPKNGAVEGVIDFSPLRKLVTQHPGLDVLNGIAYNSDTQTIFVTGKRWDKLFEVKVFKK
ncbi:glutamine cyclotransferase [Flavobacteriales bacterium 34_180_T64]|nr:glutamine cyclotransferase [Flavobacteriales bacterium 34_180_T64]